MSMRLLSIVSIVFFFCAVCPMQIAPVLAYQSEQDQPVTGKTDIGTIRPPGDMVIFGGDKNYQPFEWVTKSGQSKGFIIDLEDALARKGGKRPVHVTASWSDLMAALDAGTIDVLPMFMSEERQKYYTFSSPFYYLKHAIFARPGLKGITNIGDLSAMRVAAEARSYVEERMVADYPDIELVHVADALEALQAVISGEADATIVAGPVADDLIRIHNLKVQRYGLPFWAEANSFAVRKDRVELAQWVSRSLEQVLKSGEYDKIFDRWKGVIEPKPDAFVGLKSPQVAFGAGIVLLTVTAFFGFYYYTDERHARRRMVFSSVPDVSYAQYDMGTGLPGGDLFAQEVKEHLERSKGNRARWKYAIFRLTTYEDIVRLHGARVAISLASCLANRLRDREFLVVGYFGRGYFGVLSERPLFGFGPHSILDPIELSDEEVMSPVVCGVTRIPEEADHLDDFAHYAETALSQCMARRRNWLLYDSSMEPDPVDPRIIRAFRLGEIAGLSAVFQPQVDAMNGTVIGAESLVRWEHPDLGAVSPGKFIPLLEQAGLVGKVTDFMLEKAMVQAALLAKDGHPITISVNLSVSDLMEMDAYDKIAACLDWCNCPASQFVVELTETAFADDPDLVRATLMRLRRLGVRTSIDDFGTGFASLSYLSEFPADEVKIDRLFVSRMRHSARDRAIIRSSIALAHDLGLTVIAEGVEDNETLTMLREEGCDQVQGYGISRPLSESAFMDFLKVPSLQF